MEMCIVVTNFKGLCIFLFIYLWIFYFRLLNVQYTIGYTIPHFETVRVIIPFPIFCKTTTPLIGNNECSITSESDLPFNRLLNILLLNLQQFKIVHQSLRMQFSVGTTIRSFCWDYIYQDYSNYKCIFNAYPGIIYA